MTNNPFFSDVAAKAAVNAVAALCNSGSIKIYTGSQPTDANTAVSGQTLLATFAFGSTAFATAVTTGTAPTRVANATANSIADVNAVATGTAAWFRVLESDGTTVVFDGSVATSGADLDMTDTSLTSGEDCSISNFVLSAPE